MYNNKLCMCMSCDLGALCIDWVVLPRGEQKSIQLHHCSWYCIPPVKPEIDTRTHQLPHFVTKVGESAAIAMHSSIGEYRPNVEVWSAYTEQLEHYFATNKVANGSKKRAVFLSICGPSTYGLICSLESLQKATDFSYMEIVKKVNRHYNPRPLAVVHRLKFN